jgi:hypothetical protein
LQFKVSPGKQFAGPHLKNTHHKKKKKKGLVEWLKVFKPGVQNPIKQKNKTTKKEKLKGR